MVAGRIPAGKYHKLACQRHLRDRQREATPAFPYRFDQAKVDRFVQFVGLLRHYKGEWAGQPIQLEPWQQFMLGSLFGWVHPVTGLRRFRSTYFEIPRKNGKSTIAATAALYLTFFDGEPGAEGYTIATKRDQAKIVFADAKKMVESSGLKNRIGVRVANLHRTDTACKLEPLGADHDSTDGLNPHLVVIDEWHAYKDRGLIDVMETATGARRHPVIFGITTAGSDPVSPCGDQHDYACKVLDGVLQDESILAFIAHADSAHTVSYSFPQSLRELVQLCSCRVKECVAPTSADTLSASTTREGSASPVTPTGLRSKTLDTRRGSASGSGSGQSGTRNVIEETSAAGMPTTQTEGELRRGEAYSRTSTEYRSMSTLGSNAHSGNYAAFADKHFLSSSWITATIRARYAAYCASDVIPDWASSEILQSAYDEHSPTCAARQIGQVRSGGELFVSHPDDDPWAEATWAKANPNWGVSVKPDDMRALAQKAQNMPAAAGTFRQKRLNQWVNADTPWLSMDGWRKGQSSVSREVFAESLRGQTCYAAIDLSSKIDLTAVTLLFPPTGDRATWAALVYAFTPEDTLDERQHRDRAPYRIWKDAGWLTTTPGNRIDYDAIRDKVNELDTVYDLRQIGFDPWNAGNLQQNLIADGFDADQIIEIPQNISNMSAPCKDFEADVLDGFVDSGGNPLMAWCISNAVVLRDNKDNMFPTKKKSRGRIDPVVAAIMARKLAGVEKPVQQFDYPEWISY